MESHSPIALKKGREVPPQSWLDVLRMNHGLGICYKALSTDSMSQLQRTDKDVLSTFPQKS